jgi:cysteine desulfurase family protein (TIGR01976 family)
LKAKANGSSTSGEELNNAGVAMRNIESLLESIRAQFPALSKRVNGFPAVFFDGPAGTQVPQRVLDAIVRYLTEMNANHGGMFATSRESDELLDATHEALAELLGASDPQCVFFGPNMTSLTFALSRALAKTWERDDEVVVTRLDHDANVTPWVLAAEDAGAKVRFVDFCPRDCTLDLDDLRAKLSRRTRLLAVGCASNSVGTVNPVKQICEWAREVGALSFLDAVHYAPHARMDVQDWGCDFLACSAYKFFGPHIGVAWGRRELLESLPAYKVRPAPDDLPGKWMTGTQNHECLAGTLAAVDYLADLGRQVSGNATLSRRAALDCAYREIGDYERRLAARLIHGLKQLKAVTIYGITERERFEQRLPTVSITHDRKSPQELAKWLGERGIFVWHGHYYALQLTEVLKREPEGMVRIGLAHYNTEEEVDRLLNALAEL